MRRALSLAILIGFTVSLAGCTSSQDNAEENGCLPTGQASESIAASVDDAYFEATDELEAVEPFEASLTVESVERSVVVEGQGERVTQGDAVSINYAFANGNTGERFESGSGPDGGRWFIVDSSGAELSGLSQALVCSTIGTLFTAVIPAEAAYSAEGLTGEASALGDLLGGLIEIEEVAALAPGDPLVAVVEVVSIAPRALSRAEGAPQALPVGFPSVALADNGAPTISMTDGDPPLESQSATLIRGDGDRVTQTSTLVFHYASVEWGSQEPGTSTWEDDEPQIVEFSGLSEGVQSALFGQTVGSQVIVILPPDPDVETPNATFDNPVVEPPRAVVFVIDILAAFDR